MIFYKSFHNFQTTQAIISKLDHRFLCLSTLCTVIYKQIDSAVKKIWNKECGDVIKTHWGNFVNFSYKLKQDVFTNISAAAVSPKCKMVGTTLGTKNKAKTILNNYRNYSHIMLAFPVQLANGMKILISLVLFCSI